MTRWMPLVTLAGLLGFCVAGVAPAAAVPPGFSDSLVAVVGEPTALAFAPDGRLLVTTKGGTLRIIQNDSLLPALALAIPADRICADHPSGESGLLGVAVHPNFAANHFIYLFYSFRKPDTSCVNRASRFTLPASNVIDPASEMVLIDNMPFVSGSHNAGDVQFGKDGMLYVTIGDGGISAAAREEHKLSGKVLRVTDSGGIPADNPFQATGMDCRFTGSTTPGNKCRETFSWGLRNPFRIAFDPNAAGTRFFINDVGQDHWEEIDLAQAGTDYGWHICEGTHATFSNNPCTAAPPGMVNPVFEYAHGTTIPGTTSPPNCQCVSGGAFVPDGLWPGFDGAYLFGDCVCGGLFRLDESGGVFSASDFATTIVGVVHLAFGPFGSRQALYYTGFAGGGQVRRITGPTGPTDFFTVTPCRAVDTRQPPGPLGGPALAAGTQRTFVLAGVCGVPVTAVSVAVNLTVVAPTAGGNLTVFPDGVDLPGTSTLNFAAGQTRANNAVVELGAMSGLAVSHAGPRGATAHVVVDVVGYFE